MLHDLFLNGNASRKFFIVLTALLLLTGMTIACTWSAGIASALITFTGGLTGLVGIYCGGNVLAKKWDKGQSIEVKASEEKKVLRLGE